MSQDKENTPEQDQERRRQKGLQEIRRARNRLFVCFWTFPVYVFAVMQVLDAGKETTMIMYAYMALYAAFGVNVASRRCPDCHQQFFVKTFFMNPFRSSCVHCGCSLKDEESLGA